ncbi:MAG TPA: hypothetical protein VNF07_10295 [Acidimicrobiales bacterium]|nr:hypothetical protein [Acidimicrobiales bacterium]
MRAFGILIVCVLVAICVGVGAIRGSSTPLAYLDARGVGPAHFGMGEGEVVRLLQPALGAPNAEGINTGCGPRFTEVAWHDLVLEFRFRVFTGYRFDEGGWPVTVPGSPSDRVSPAVTVPALETRNGITLGSTVGELRAAYGRLKLVGAVQWGTPDGLVVSESAAVVNAGSPQDTIVEIETDVCGAF